MVSTAQSSAEDDSPMLRIDAGMHTAQIKHILSDAAGRIALTVSDDKTARLWEVSTGRLIRVLKGPVGTASEGRLCCGALSPDRRRAVVGGWTGPSGGSVSIYLFDPLTGMHVRRIGGLLNIVLDTAYSPDGRYLAAVFGHEDGLRVWERSSGRKAGHDPKYANDSYGVDWSGNDRLVTTCYDGHLRLYTLKSGAAGPQPNLIKESLVQGKKRPFVARFSPDGSEIAVGFRDSTAVMVVDGNDLTFRFAPDTSGVANGNLESVCWADDGGTLAAGGTWPSTGAFSILRRWPQAGRGKPSDTHVSQDIIFDLRPLPQGRLLFCTGDPTWGLVTEDGSSKTLGSLPIAYCRSGLDAFGASNNGEIVSFRFQLRGKSHAPFSVSHRTLLTDPNAFKSFQGLLVEGLDISDWNSTTEPKLTGKPLPLNPYEESRSFAIAHDASLFLLDADWSLRCFSSNGEQRWVIDAAGVAWAVNLADRDRLAIAPFGDGTICWYRVQDGKELLAFLLNADQKRWVLWTPEDYYDCSAGGEDLMGRYVNRSQEHEAAFFPSSRFREHFYRPDVIQRALSTRDVNEALTQANAETGRQPAQSAPKIDEVINRLQPPKIELSTVAALGDVSLPAGAKDFTVHYRVVRCSSEPVQRVLVFPDGQPVYSAQAEIPFNDTAEASATTPIAEHDCILTLSAKNRFASSEAATLRLKGAPGDLNASLNPKAYLLAAGISRYGKNDQLTNLHFADKNAQDFAAAFARQARAQRLSQKVEVNLLIDEEATFKNIFDGLNWHQTTTKDLATIFFSGHGKNDQQLRFFFCPHGFDKEHPSSTGISYAQISEAVRAIPGKLLFIIDCVQCFGELLAANRDSQLNITQVMNELSSAENGAIALASSTGTQLSQELEQEHNGAFTKAIVEGLDGQVDLSHNGVIRV
jgi:hypothetical protein